MTIDYGAAWTPDAPDSGLADDPAQLIADGGQPFDPTTLDAFEQVEICAEPVKFVFRPSDRDEPVTVCCELDPEHDGPHQATISWGVPS